MMVLMARERMRESKVRLAWVGVCVMQPAAAATAAMAAGERFSISVCRPHLSVSYLDLYSVLL
jgi:hypothetical protein